MKKYIINGAPGAGKDTFCNMVKDIMLPETCFILSTIDFVKEIALKCGWDGQKTPKARKFLSDLKDILTEFNDAPHQHIINDIKIIENDYKMTLFDSSDDCCIFIMCREPEEIARLAKELNATTIFVQRNSAEEDYPSNHADANVYNYDYDITIYNNGTLKNLAELAMEFVGNEELNFPHWKTIIINDDGKICKS